jgi:hypothetical protein
VSIEPRPGEVWAVDFGLAALPKRSAVNIQGFAGIDQHALIRKLGRLSDEQF